MARMITNRLRGRCACGTVVQPAHGYVHERRITCIQCVPIPAPTPERAFSVMYQGCADERESLHEWFADHFDNESHYLGWEVGDQ